MGSEIRLQGAFTNIAGVLVGAKNACVPLDLVFMAALLATTLSPVVMLINLINTVKGREGGRERERVEVGTYLVIKSDTFDIDSLSPP